MFVLRFAMLTDLGETLGSNGLRDATRHTAAIIQPLFISGPSTEWRIRLAGEYEVAVGAVQTPFDADHGKVVQR